MKRQAPALAGVSFVGLEMTLLGALIAFAHTLFHSVHAPTTRTWVLSQMDDQRLGMWVPWACSDARIPPWRSPDGSPTSSAAVPLTSPSA